MLKDIIAVEPLEHFRLRLTFEDGVEGVIDVRKLVPFQSVFTNLTDPKEFASVRVDVELGTIVWPSGADLDPDVLYALVTGQALPSYKVTAKTFHS